MSDICDVPCIEQWMSLENGCIFWIMIKIAIYIVIQIILLCVMGYKIYLVIYKYELYISNIFNSEVDLMYLLGQDYSWLLHLQ